MLSLLLAALAVFQAASPMDVSLPEASELLPHREVLAVKALPPPDPEILKRPIFAPDRRPMAESMAGYVVLGIGMAGSIATALLQGSGGRALRVHNGDAVAGWRVAAVTQDQLTFERDGERRMLKLDMKARRMAAAPLATARPK